MTPKNIPKRPDKPRKIQDNAFGSIAQRDRETEQKHAANATCWYDDHTSATNENTATAKSVLIVTPIHLLTL